MRASANSAAHLEQTTYQGKKYVAPSNSSFSLFFYNKDVFDKFGVPYPRDGWTTEQFRDTCQKLTKTDPADRFYGFQAPTGYSQLVAFLRSDGDQEWDTVVDPRKATWTAGAILDHLDWHLNRAVNTLKLSPGAGDTAGGANTFQQTGNVGLVYNGAFFLSQVWGPLAKRQGGINYDVVGLPAGKQHPPRYRLAVEGQVLTALSKQRDAAWEVQKWITDAPGQRRIAEGGRMPNILEHIRAFWVDPTRQRYNVQNVAAFLKGYAPPDVSMSHVIGGVTEAELMAKAGRAYFDKIAAGTPAQTLGGELNAALQRVLDDHWATQK